MLWEGEKMTLLFVGTFIALLCGSHLVYDILIQIVD